MNIVSNTIYFFNFRIGTFYEIYFALLVLGGILIVFIIFSIFVKFSVTEQEKINEIRAILKKEFNLSFTEGNCRILDFSELANQIGLTVNFTKSKLLGYGEKINWFIAGSLVGNFKKTGDIIHYLSITEADRETDYGIDKRILYSSRKKSAVVQKLNKEIQDFYLYSKTPDKKINDSNLDLVNNLKLIYKVNPENIINKFNPEIIKRLVDYYKEFWGVSFEVFNGYLIILTNYPNLDSQGNIGLAVKKYENFFQKSIDLKKTIEKYY